MRKCTFVSVGLLFFTPQLAQSQLELPTTYMATQERTIAIKNAPQVVKNANQSEARYYYYPNLQTYYDRQKGFYLSCIKGNWITSKFLDLNARGYSIKNGNFKKVEGYSGDQPYTLLSEHKVQYPSDYSSRPSRKPIVSTE